MTIEGHSLLKKLSANGLHDITAFYDWEQEDGDREISIFFGAPLRSSTARYIAGQVRKAACDKCVLRTGLECTKTVIDDFLQIRATVTSGAALTKKQWQEEIKSFPCEPQMHKPE